MAFNKDKAKSLNEVIRSADCETEDNASVLDILIDMVESTFVIYTKPTFRHQLYLQESSCSPRSGVPIQHEYSSGYTLGCATPWSMDNSEWLS